MVAFLVKVLEESSLSEFQGGALKELRRLKKKKKSPNKGKIILTIKGTETWITLHSPQGVPLSRPSAVTVPTAALRLCHL